MTSKLDTAGMVEQEAHRIAIQVATSGKTGRVHALAYEPAKEGARIALQSKIEALTQVAAPDMDPVAYRWTTSDINGDDWPWTYTGKAGADIHSSHGHTVEPLYSAVQFSALQERADRAERERDEAHQIASKLTKALVGLTPGGSEYFTRCEALDDYFADADQCVGVIRERFGSGHQAKIERLNERRRAEAAEARVAELEAAMTAIETELQSSIETHRFNARHMIAEDSLQDAWKMLDMACEQFEIDANSLEIPLRQARAALAHKGEGDA